LLLTIDINLSKNFIFKGFLYVVIILSYYLPSIYTFYVYLVLINSHLVI